MVLSKRERIVFFATLAALGILGLDRLVLTPLLTRYAETQVQRTRLKAELDRTQSLIARRRLAAPRWRKMMQTGMKRDPAEAESQLLHALRDWGEESGVAWSLLKPDRLTEKTRLPEIALQASGTGPMRAVAGLLWRIQTASIPIKVTEMHLNSRKEGTDDLALQLRVTTVYLPARPTPASAPAEPGDDAGGP